jgi:hypothetical protein
MTENRRRRNLRAAAYQRALARLRDQHPAEFEELYALERAEQHPTTRQTDAQAR